MSELPAVMRIPRSTGTHADVFAAVGLAELLSSLPNSESVRLIERDGEFEIQRSDAGDDVTAALVAQAPGYPFLKTSEKVRVPRHAKDVVDYKAEKAKADRNKQARAIQGRGKRRAVDAETQQFMQQEQLRDDWRLLQVLNTLQGDEISNKVHEAIIQREPERFRKEVAAGLEALAHRRPSGLAWPVSTVQIFTPTAAKGYSRLKPDSTSRNDKTKDGWADPFIEWLKYRGYFRVACPFFEGSDVRLLCPIPRDVSVGALGSIARELRGARVYGGPPKIDGLAVLTMAELLVRHSEEYHDPDAEIFPGLSLRGRSPADAISGAMVTHYQSLGNAKAVSAMSTIALPGWFRIETRSDADAWRGILDEHKRVLRGLQDDHSDEIGLLVRYRRFLEKRGDSAFWALVEFVEHYGPFLIRAREQGRKVRAFRTDYFGRIAMGTSPNLTQILMDDGFRAVATAVRKATVSAQAQKAMKKSDYREIRYDLLHDLRRKRSLPGGGPLIEAVSDFVCEYNRENARRREMGKAAPRNVTTGEFSSFAALVERHGASLVGALLGAYASCREPRDDEAPELEGEPAERTGRLA